MPNLLHADRRSFLSQLVALPLIGGGLSIIGQPKAVAEPVTRDLLMAYDDWLLLERRYLIREMFPDHPEMSGMGFDPKTAGGRFYWRAYGTPLAPQPSTHAALVLSTVDYDWKEPRHA